MLLTRQSVLPRLAPTAHWLPDKARGFSIHSVTALHGARTVFPHPPLRTRRASFPATGSPGVGFRLRPYDRACHPVPVRRLPPKVRVDFTTLLRLIGYRERQLPGFPSPCR